MNLELIKQKLSDLDKKSTGGSSKHFWKPELGKHVIRIIPYVHNKEWPFTELFFYYKLKKGTVLSPITFDKPDPVYEAAQQLKNTGDKEEWKAGNALEPKPRTYVPVLIRGRESEGPKFWGFGKEVFQQILKIIDDPDYGDITDPKSGRDLTVEIVKTDQAYPKTHVRAKPNKSVMTDSKDVLEQIKETPNIHTLWPEPTYDELKKLLEAYLNNEAADESEQTRTDDSDPFSSDFDDSDIPEIPRPSGIKEISTESDFDELFK